MKRYRFRLESVARVRRVREEQARAELLESRRKLDEAHAELQRRLGSYDQRGRATAASPNSFRAERDRDTRMANAVTAAMAAEAAARTLVGRRVDEWVAAARENAALDRLDLRRREEHEDEVRRAEQRELDDLAAGRIAGTRIEDDPAGVAPTHGDRA
ncbi:MAG TPA: flagellar FliJ family protein [Acidimicrobiales bacterium]|nr:flagellar FliJ family protein [Acidimicrobiales bacterium]